MFYVRTTRTYYGCDVQNGVTLSCATATFRLMIGPYQRSTFGYEYGWELLGDATFYTPGNLDIQRSQIPVSIRDAGFGGLWTIYQHPTLYTGTNFFLDEQPPDVHLIRSADVAPLLGRLEEPWTLGVFYGPEGAPVPRYTSDPIPSTFTRRSITMHVTPEPGTVVLLATGLGTLALFGPIGRVARRRRHGAV